MNIQSSFCNGTLPQIDSAPSVRLQCAYDLTKSAVYDVVADQLNATYHFFSGVASQLKGKVEPGIDWVNDLVVSVYKQYHPIGYLAFDNIHIDITGGSRCKSLVTQAIGDLLSCPHSEEIILQVGKDKAINIGCRDSQKASVDLESREILVPIMGKQSMEEVLLHGLFQLKNADESIALEGKKCDMGVDRYLGRSYGLKRSAICSSSRIGNRCIEEGYWTEKKGVKIGACPSVDQYFKDQIQSSADQSHRLCWRRDCNPAETDDADEQKMYDQLLDRVCDSWWEDVSKY